MWNDFYDEPSEFEMQIEEFKDGLRKAVKQEYLTKIERLEKELAELKDLKKNWNSKLAELEEAKREAERAKIEAGIAKSQAKQNAKTLRLQELLENCFDTAYGITINHNYASDKCDKCDKEGFIHFLSPQGNECREFCNCRKKIPTYTITESKICKIKSHNTKVYLYFEYKSRRDWDEIEDEYRIVSGFMDDTPFEKIAYNHRLFLNKEKAQAYCDWLNSKEKK